MVAVMLALSVNMGCAVALWADDRPVAPVSRIEVVLAYHYKGQVPALTEEFAQAGMPNVHFQFARQGQPPQNIGMGRAVSADKAREAIKLAVKYNLGVGILLPERLFPARFVTIASSNFDDTVEYPISKEDLTHLLDPSLTTEQFHDLYGQLTSVPLKPAGRY